MTVMCVVDGNSLVHRAYYALAASGLRAPDGQPSWAIKGLWTHLCAATDRAGADSLVVAFDKGPSLRAQRYPAYKAGRADKHPDLVAQLAAAPQHLAAAGVCVLAEAGFEADDVLAAVAAQRGAAGQDTVLVTSDRDAFALIGPRVRVLRVVNGGPEAWPMLNEDRLRTLVGVSASQYRTYAALRGDASDNLVGVSGIGEKTASALLTKLAELGVTLPEAIADADEGSDLLVRLVGKARAGKLLSEQGREALARNMELMAPLPGVDVSALAGAGLPLDRQRLHDELHRWALASVVDSASVSLCGLPEVPAEQQWGGDDLLWSAPDPLSAPPRKVTAPPARPAGSQMSLDLR